MATIDKLRDLHDLPVSEPGAWTTAWQENAYMGRGMPVQAHTDAPASAAHALRAGDVGLAFRCWYDHGTGFARVAVISGDMAGEVIDTYADDWIDATAEAVRKVRHA